MSANDTVPVSAFETSGLTKRYGRVAALAGIDLQVPQGAFMLLVGANGAGKTTLLHLLLHLVVPTAGSIRVFGKDATNESASPRTGIAFVPEDGGWPFPRMRLRELLAFHAAYYPDWDAVYAGRLSSQLDLRLDRRVCHVSKGELRRARLVAALAHRPRALILDEPTDGLDPLVRRKLLEVMAEHMAENPVTFLVSTHHSHELDGLADHIALLHQGRMLGAFTCDGLREEVRQVVVRWPAARMDLGPNTPGVVSRQRHGVEELLTARGPVEDLCHVIAGRGGIVSEIRRLTLEEAAVTLLAAAETSAGASQTALEGR